MERRVVFRVHAVIRMFERGIPEEEIITVLDNGETIESYPRDRPYPSRLLLGYAAGRAIHVVAADNPEDAQTIVITVYEPDREVWEPDLRRRKR